MADGSIVIDTALDTNGITKGLNTMNNTISKSVATATRVLNSGIANATRTVVSNVNTVSASLTRVKGLVMSIFGIGSLLYIGKQALELSSSITEVDNVVEKAFGNMRDEMDALANTAVDTLGMSRLTAYQTGATFMSLGKSMVGDAETAKTMAIELTKLTGNLASFRNESHELVSTRLKAIYTGETEAIENMGISLKVATLNQYALSKGMSKTYDKMTESEKIMLRYQYVMEQFGYVGTDFLDTQNSWANQTRILSENWKELLTVLGDGLVSVLTPVIKALNEMISSMITMAKFIGSALGKILNIQKQSVSTGTSASETYDEMADSAEDYGDAVSSASKKTSKALSAFDELNNATSSSSSSGSGTSSTDFSIDGIDTDDIEAIEDEENEIESVINNWFDLGQYFNEKITEWLEGIDWDSIKEKFSNFGKDLAEFLNGLISPSLFSELGRNVAEAINSAFEFLDSFGETFNWKNFGRSLGTGLNKYMKTLNWKTILSSAKNWGEGIANALNSYLSTTSFDLVGETIANRLNTALQFLYSFGTTFNWTLFGESISQEINSFFRTFKFSQLGATLKTWANGLLTAMITAIKNTNWARVGEKIGEFLSAVDFASILKNIGQLIWQAINAGLETYVSTFSVAPIETAITTALLAMKFTGVGASLLTTLKSAIIPTLTNPVAWAIEIPIGITLLLTAIDQAYIDSKVAEFEKEQVEKYGSTFQEIYDNASNAVDEVTAFNEQTKAQLEMKDDNILFLETIASKYEALREKTNLTNGEEALMIQYQDELIDAFPELQQYYNEQTGLLDTTAESISNLIAEKEKEIKLNAISEAWTETLKQQIDLEQQVKTVTEQLETAQTDLETAQQKVNTAMDEQGDHVNLEPLQEEYASAQEAVDSLTASLEQYQKGLDATNEQVAYYESLYDEVAGGTKEVAKEQEYLNTVFSDAKDVWDKWNQKLVDGKGDLKELSKETSDYSQDVDNATSKTKELKTSMDDAETSTKNVTLAIQGLDEATTTNLENVSNTLNTWFDDTVSPLFSEETWTTFGTTMNTTMATMLTTFMTDWTTQFDTWKENNELNYFGLDIWTTILTDGVLQAYYDVWKIFSTDWETNIEKWKTDYVEPYFSVDTWTAYGQNMKDGIVGGFKAIVSEVGGILGTLVDVFNSQMSNVANSINSMIASVNSMSSKLNVSTISSVGWSNIPKVEIPALATGAVLPANKPFLSIVGDQKNGTNIESPLSTMVEAFNKANNNGESLEVLKEILTVLINKETGITDQQIFDSVQKSARTYTQTTGRFAF